MRILSLLILNLLICSTAFAQGSTEWQALEKKLVSVTRQVKRAAPDTDAQVTFLPEINRLIGHTLALELQGAEKARQIEVFVELLGAIREADFASSTVENTQVDYRQNKAAYDKAMAKLPASQRKSLLEGYSDFAKLEELEPRIQGPRK